MLKNYLLKNLIFQSPSDGVLKITIEEYQENLSIEYDENLFYARVLFNYNPMNDIMHPCKEASIELKAGDIFEICDWSEEQQWWQGRILSSFCQSHAPSLSAITNILNTLNSMTKNVARLIPSKMAQEKTIIKYLADNKALVDFNSFDFKKQMDEKGENEIFIPVTYEELCIFDPIIQSPHKRPIAIFFGLDNKLVSSFKCNSTDVLFTNSSFYNNLNDIVDFILTMIQNPDFQLKLPSLYLVKPAALGTPLINKTLFKNNPFLKFFEKTTQQFLSKTQFDNELQNERIKPSVFDNTVGYRLNEIWQDFLEKSEQLIIFPSFENFNYFRNSTRVGKICFNVLINLNEISNSKVDAVNLSGTLKINNKKPVVVTSKHKLNDCKHFFDVYMDTNIQPLDELLSMLKTYIHKINQIPSFVVK